MQSTDFTHYIKCFRSNGILKENRLRANIVTGLEMTRYHVVWVLLHKNQFMYFECRWLGFILLHCELQFSFHILCDCGRTVLSNIHKYYFGKYSFKALQ